MRSQRRYCRAHSRDVCCRAAVQLPLSKLQQPSKRSARPQVQYSISKRDVSGEDVAQLLSASRAPYMMAYDRPRAQHYTYWSRMPDAKHSAKVDLAVQRSIAVVAAYANVDVYSQPGWDDAEPELNTEGLHSAATAHSSMSNLSHHSDHGGSVPGSHSNSMDPVSAYGCNEQARNNSSHSSSSSWSSNSSWGWPSLSAGQPRPAKRSRKSLIGFARAIGDESLVCTIFDLAVHPEFQGFGIGQRVLRLLVQQLYNKGIYDIGLVAPAQVQPFFSACNFEDDRENSLCLTFTGHAGYNDEPVELDLQQVYATQGRLGSHQCAEVADPVRSHEFGTLATECSVALQLKLSARLQREVPEQQSADNLDWCSSFAAAKGLAPQDCLPPPDSCYQI